MIGREITRAQAQALMSTGWREFDMKDGTTFTYLPPNGVGATGKMSSLFGYAGKECRFFVACLGVLR